MRDTVPPLSVLPRGIDWDRRRLDLKANRQQLGDTLSGKLHRLNCSPCIPQGPMQLRIPWLHNVVYDFRSD